MSINENTNEDLKKLTFISMYFEKHLSEKNESLDCIYKKIVNCKERINELEKELETYIEKKDNSIYFSPSYAKSYEKKEELMTSLNQYKIKLNDYMSCLKEINSNIDQISGIIVYINKEIQKIGTYNCDKENDRLNILEIQELERKRIARELHDSTVQNLTGLIHKTELCCKLVDLDGIRAKLELDTMTKTIGNIINDMRTIIYNLRPMSIDDFGLKTTVERFIKQLKSDNENLHIELHIENDEFYILPVVNLTLFRIIQEACNNASRHAKANLIKIDLKYSDKYIDLIIHDNGIGFNEQYIKKDNNERITGFGLSIMKERVYLLYGNIEIDSKENEGTTIKVKVPLKSEMEEKNDTN